MKRKNLQEEKNTDLIFLSITEEQEVVSKKENKKETKDKNNVSLNSKEFISINTGNLVNYSLLEYQYENKDIQNFPKEGQEVISFIGKEGLNWPQSTEALCWWCCHSFSGSPIPIPVNYDDLKKVFKVYGNFCSFQCAKAYSFQTKNSERNTYLLTYLQYKLSGKIETIKPAPPKETLKLFGGILEIEDFRTTKSIFSLVKPPFLPFNSRIQEEKIEQKINKVPKNTRLTENKYPEEKQVKKLSNLGIKTIKKK